MERSDGVVIEAGDWVVGGSTIADLDYGRVYEDGGRLMVAWLGQGQDQRTPIEADDGGVEVYTSERDAREAYQARCETRQDAAPAPSDESCEHSRMRGDTCEECGDSCSRQDVGATADGICHDSECPIHGGAR